MLQALQFRPVATIIHNNNLKFKRSTDKKSLKNQKSNSRYCKQRRGQDGSILKDSQSLDNPSDCKTVCSLNVANFSTFIGNAQCLQSCQSYSGQKQYFANREMSLLKQKRRFRDSSIAKTNEIKKLNKEITELKNENKRLSKNNKNLSKELNEFKRLFIQIQKQLDQQKLPFCLSCVPKFQVQKQDQEQTRQDSQNSLTLYQEKIQKLQQQLQQLSQYTQNTCILRTQNKRLKNQLQQQQLFYSTLLKQNQEELAMTRQEIKRLNVQLDVINRKYHHFIQKQKEKVFEQRQKYLQIKEEMNKVYKQLKKLQITERVKKQMQIRTENYGECNYNLTPDSSLELL